MLNKHIKIYDNNDNLVLETPANYEMLHDVLKAHGLKGGSFLQNIPIIGSIAQLLGLGMEQNYGEGMSARGLSARGVSARGLSARGVSARGVSGKGYGDDPSGWLEQNPNIRNKIIDSIMNTIRKSPNNQAPVRNLLWYLLEDAGDLFHISNIDEVIRRDGLDPIDYSGQGMSARGMSARGMSACGISRNAHHIGRIHGYGIEGHSLHDMHGGFLQALIPFIPTILSAIPSVLEMLKGSGTEMPENEEEYKMSFFNGQGIKEHMQNIKLHPLAIQLLKHKPDFVDGIKDNIENIILNRKQDVTSQKGQGITQSVSQINMGPPPSRYHQGVSTMGTGVRGGAGQVCSGMAGDGFQSNPKIYKHSVGEF